MRPVTSLTNFWRCKIVLILLLSDFVTTELFYSIFTIYPNWLSLSISMNNVFHIYVPYKSIVVSDYFTAILFMRGSVDRKHRLSLMYVAYIGLWITSSWFYLPFWMRLILGIDLSFIRHIEVGFLFWFLFQLWDRVLPKKSWKYFFCYR